MQKKKPGLHVWLLLIGCALPILLVLTVPLRGQLAVSDAENRSLAQFPAFTLQGFVSGDFQQQLEEALGDQYPFGEEIKGANKVTLNLGEEAIEELALSPERRDIIDALTDYVKRPQVGAGGMVYVKYNADGSFKSSVDKFYSQADLKAFAAF